MDNIAMPKQSRSGFFSRIGFIVCFCFLITMAIAMDAHAEKTVIKLTIRYGQKLQLSIKDAPQTLTWNVTKGSSRLKKKKVNGRFTARGTGTAVVKTTYEDTSYVFRIKIKKRKSGQEKLVSIVASESGIVADVPKLGIATKPLSVKFAESQVIIVGDSRCVGMYNTVKGSATWYAKTNEGLSWLQNTVWKKEWKKLKKIDMNGRVVVFNLGVNDLGNASSYVTTLNSYGEQIIAKGGSVYFMTVNPVDEAEEANHGYTVKNSQIVTFNQTLASGLSSDFGFINTYDYLAENGFKTVDGVHYTGDTYKVIYSLLSSVVMQ